MKMAMIITMITLNVFQSLVDVPNATGYNRNKKLHVKIAEEEERNC